MIQRINVPLSTAQAFPVTLQINGTTLSLNLRLRYNKIAGYWLLTIRDANQNLLMDAIPLITGGNPAANVLAPYGYLGIGSAYVINVVNSDLNVPDSLGFSSGAFQLWFGDNP